MAKSFGGLGSWTNGYCYGLSASSSESIKVILPCWQNLSVERTREGHRETWEQVGMRAEAVVDETIAVVV